MSNENRRNGELERRDFLGTVAAGGAVGAAALSSSGCSALLRQRMVDDPSPESIEAFFSRLDTALDEIDARPVARRSLEVLREGDVPTEESPEEREQADRADALGRRIMRAMLVAGMIHDLPRETRATAPVQQRLRLYESELDGTVLETAQLLATCPDAVRNEIGGNLRDDPELAMRFGEVLDERAREMGMETGGRGKLRGTCMHIAGRLRRQPPSLLFDECLDKMERDVGRHGVSVALWRGLTTDAPAHVLWQGVPGQAESVAKSPEEGAPEPAATAEEPSEEALIRDLTDRSAARRVEAARALGALRSEAAVPALARGLQEDPDPRVRGWLLHALNAIGTPEARRALMRGHQDPDAQVRALAEQLAPAAARPSAPPAAPAPAPATPAVDAETPSSRGDETFEVRQRRLRSATTGVGIAGNVMEGVGAITLGIGAGVGNPYAMTTGGVMLGLGFIYTIATLSMYGVHRRRVREGRIRTRRRSRNRRR